MGLYPRLASTITEEVARGKSSLPLRLVPSDTVFQETSIMFVDLTQYLFISANMKMTGLYRKRICYDSWKEFLDSDDPIGEVQYQEGTGEVTNVIDVFDAELPGTLLSRKIEALESEWRNGCETRGVDCNLRTIILAIDGDSPPAKMTTRKKRIQQSPASATVKRIRGWCNDPVVDETRLQCRMFASCEDSDGRTVASLQRFLCHRRNRDVIVEQMISILRKNTHINTTLYVARGRGYQEQDVQLVRVSGIYMHLSQLPESIPYFEADSIIPYLWSYVKNQESGAIAVTRDSDMLVTLLSMDDPKFRLLTRMPRSSLTDEMFLFESKVAVSSDQQKRVSTDVHLDILLHLTIGGSDYVENFPRLGVVGIMRGIGSILGGHVRVPRCIRRVRSGDLVSFEHDSIQIGGVEWHRLRNVLDSDDSLFPIRVRDKVILVRLDESLAKDSVAWYKSHCKSERKSVTDKEVQTFVMAMRRRLFFLSMMTECRVGMELDMCWQKDIAVKCGYDYTNDFAYLK